MAGRSDFKQGPRVRDREALAAFALEHAGEPCDWCERRPGVHIHHAVFRSQGGGDVPDNLVWLPASAWCVMVTRTD